MLSTTDLIFDCNRKIIIKWETWFGSESGKMLAFNIFDKMWHWIMRRNFNK